MDSKSEQRLNKWLTLLEDIVAISKNDQDNVCLFPTKKECEEYLEAKKETEGVRMLRAWIEANDTRSLKEKRRRAAHNRKVQNDAKITKPEK